MIERNKVYCEDHLITMDRMEPNSIPLVVTSPIYDKIRKYNGFSFDLEKCAAGLFRVIEIGGVLVWVVGDETEEGSESLTSFRMALHFKEVGFRLHDTMIYKKLNFSNPSSNRYHQTFEYMFVFSKGAPKTFNPIMDRKNISAGKMGSKGVNTVTQQDGSKKTRARKIVNEYGMRHNVWEGPTRGQEDMCKKQTHPGLMPRWLARDLILSWSNPGDLVYDPFGGEGTTAEEAIKLKRDFIISELSANYCDTAIKNTQKLIDKNEFNRVNDSAISKMISDARRFSPYKAFTANAPVVKVQSPII